MALDLDPGVGEDARGEDLARPKSLDAHGAKPLTPDEQAKLDQIESGLNAGNTAKQPPNQMMGGGKGGGMAKSLGSMAKGIGSFTGKNKKGLGVGGGIAGIIIVAFFSLSVLLPLKLFDIEKNLFNHNFKVEENSEKKLASKLINRLNPYTEEGHVKLTGHGFFGNKWANFKVQKFDAKLASKGVKLNIDPTTHKLISIERNGAVEDFSKAGVAESARAIIGVVNDEVPPWRIAKRLKFINLMTIRYGVSFRFWQSEKFANVKEYLQDRTKQIRNGASSDEVAVAERAAAQGKPVDPNKPTTFNDQNASGDKLIQDVQNEFTKSGSIKSAVQVGVDAIKGNKGIGFVGMAALVCQVKAIADEAVQNGYAQRAQELMRQGGSLLAAASQLRAGKSVDPAALNYLMTQYQGDANAKPITVHVNGQTTTAPTENSLDFTQAADWRRSTGEPVNSANPEMSGAANPAAKNGLAEVIGIIDGLSAAVGGNAICAVTTGILGMVVQAVELGANLFDAGVEEVASTIAKFAIQAVLVAKVVPRVLAGAAGLAITGTENAIQLISNDNSGLALMASDYSRSFGAIPISDPSYKLLADQANASDIAATKSKGLTYSLLATDNPSSLISKIIIKAPSTPQAAVTGFASMFMHLPSVFTNGLLGIIQPVHADSSSDNPNAFQRYGFTDTELDKYEVDMLANYFENTVATVNNQPISRLDVLGNPDGYAFGAEDTNQNDALHCFVNSFVNPETGANDPVCLNIGYLTQNSGQPTPSESDFATSLQKNVYDVYCQANLAGQSCPFTAAADEMLRYRLYLGYQHVGAPLISVAESGQ